MSHHGYREVGTVNEASRQRQPKPRKRWITVSNQLHYAGFPLTLDSLNVSVEGGAGGLTMTPNGRIYTVGQTARVTIRAAAILPNWLYSQVTLDIQIVPIPVTIGWTLKPEWRRLEEVTLDSLHVTKDYDNAVLRVVLPGSGRFVGPGDKVAVRVEVVPDNYFIGAAPLSGSVKVVKDTPVITLQLRSLVGLGTTVGDAVISQTAVPGPVPLAFNPPLNKVLDTLGDVQVTASFAGNALFNPAVPARATLKVMAKPTIDWPAPGQVVVGSKLTATTLNATTQPPDLPLTYTPLLDSPLKVVGDVKLSARFPGSGLLPASDPKEVTLKVIKDTPTIEWRPPLPVLLNTQLSAKTLAATLRSSLGETIALQPVFVPAVNSVATPVGDKVLKASFAGTARYEAAADKQVTLKIMANATDLGKEAMMSGRAWKGPTEQRDKELLEKWNTDDSATGIKAQAKKVMADLQGKTGEELIAYMDDFLAKATTPPDGTQTGTRTDDPDSDTFPNYIWELSNGLQVRYKPRGDGKPPVTIPPTPMFCVEGKTCVGRSGGADDVTFKVTASGEPGAYGPRQTEVPDGISTNPQNAINKLYMAGTITTTHLRCAPKQEQVITWTNPPDITVGDKLESTFLTVVAQDPAALEFRDGADTVVTKDTVLQAGPAQTLKVKGLVTNRYLASAAFKEVKVNVNKKAQAIAWKPTTTEIFAGGALGTGVLNATALGGVTPTYLGPDAKPVTATTVLAHGTPELTAVADATDTYDAATPVKVTITIKLSPQTITWEPATTEIFAGAALGTGVLNATALGGVTPTYLGPDGKPVTATTVLPHGTPELTAVADATEIYEAAKPVKVKITIKLNPQTITWKPTTTEIFAGAALGTDVLNATALGGMTPTYQTKDGMQIDAGTVLAPGPHELTATADATELYAAAAPVKVTITVLPKAEETK